MVCLLSVCLSVTLVSPAKTAAPIEMLFGLRTRMGPGNHVLDVGPDGRVFKYLHQSKCHQTCQPTLRLITCLCRLQQQQQQQQQPTTSVDVSISTRPHAPSKHPTPTFVSTSVYNNVIRSTHTAASNVSLLLPVAVFLFFFVLARGC